MCGVIVVKGAAVEVATVERAAKRGTAIERAVVLRVAVQTTELFSKNIVSLISNEEVQKSALRLTAIFLTSRKLNTSCTVV